MRRTIHVFAALLLATGCYSKATRSTTSPSSSTRGVAHEPERTPTPPQPSASLAQLIGAVDSLALTLEDPTHRGIASALEALATVIDTLPEGAGSGAEIRARASQLASSSDHIESLIQALNAAIRAIAGELDDTSASDVKVAFSNASAAVARLSPRKPLLEQAASVLAGFRAITTALVAVEGAEVPDGYAVNEKSMARGLDAVREHVKAADAAVLELASAPTWKEARISAAHALEEIALVLATVPVSSAHERQLGTTALAIRYDAARLRSVGAISFDKVEWIRHSLLMAHDALKDVVPSNTLASRLLVQSRRAAEALTGSTSFVFERSIVQDAMRGTISSLVAVVYADDRNGKTVAY